MTSLFTISDWHGDWLEPVLIPVLIRKLSVARQLNREARLCET